MAITPDLIFRAADVFLVGFGVLIFAAAIAAHVADQYLGKAR